MESKLQLLSVFTLILCCGKLCAASWWNPIKSATIDRTIPAANGTESDDFHILPVDRTTFLVTKELLLHQIDMTKIFTMNANKKTNLTNDVSVRVKMVQMQKNDRTFVATVYDGKVNLSSTNEAKMIFKNDIALKREFLYEIQFFMPTLDFVYSENLSIATHKIWRPFLRSIVTSFFPSNVEFLDRPTNEDVNEKKISVGLVKRLHYKYSKF